MIKDAIKSGLIEPDILYKLLQDKQIKNLKILDATLPAPGSDKDMRQGYAEKRLPRALFFDIEAISDQQSDLPHMLPSAPDFEKAVSALGIANDDFIILYGQEGLILGPARAWWMFRVFGHDRICVLNGGLPAWLDQWLPVEFENPVEQQKASANFKATFHKELVVRREDVLAAMDDQDALILDARPESRFSGAATEPRAGLRCGHIPGSRNMPSVSLVDKDTKKLKARDDLEEILNAHGIDEKIRILTTCGSGVTACVIALALYHTGLKNVAVYDGSWADWGREDIDTPVAVFVAR